ncbi:MAG: TolC family protein [Planctomycetes bacterium]|nr:TolC family protein [Planctomycetota bacterium]MBL7106585.1 TolC family protein [Phycisphaerae bacterium]
MLFTQTGCKSSTEYRQQADRVGNQIVQEKMEAIGRTEQFSIERSSDILRRRLLIEQNLPYAGLSSLGADQLEPIEHWPEKDYPSPEAILDPILLLGEANDLPQLTLLEALQVGARNSFEYQTRKEDIFKTALDLDLERNEFRNIFSSQVESLAKTDMSGSRTVSGLEQSGSMNVSRKLESGIEVSADLAVSLANLLTLNNASAYGVSGDATISVPLLRGSGRHIVTEPLTQAERNVVYAIYQFERFRRTFAVSIGSEYLSVLRQLDEVKNNEENYRGLILSAGRARRLSDAGRLPEVQVDQAVQDELRARNRWINAVETYKRRLDSFKKLLQLPPDARIELDRLELERLAVYSDEFTEKSEREEKSEAQVSSVNVDAQIVLEQPDMKNVGPLEIAEKTALALAFENRFDLKIAEGKIYDAQRAIVVLADSLRAELTLLGRAGFGGSRSISSASSDDIKLRTDKGIYSALLSLDLPIERTAERNAYRKGFITFERNVRDFQSLEDDIKISIRDKLRDLLESRESLLIQARSVKLAEKRVKSTNLFLEAGRAAIRDVLEAQESLLSAQNSLTAAIISYRVAELELQRDMGVLEINENGLWQEYLPGEKENVKK